MTNTHPKPASFFPGDTLEDAGNVARMAEEILAEYDVFLSVRGLTRQPAVEIQDNPATLALQNDLRAQLDAIYAPRKETEEDDEDTGDGIDILLAHEARQARANLLSAQDAAFEQREYELDHQFDSLDLSTDFDELE